MSWQGENNPYEPPSSCNNSNYSEHETVVPADVLVVFIVRLNRDYATVRDVGARVAKAWSENPFIDRWRDSPCLFFKFPRRCFPKFLAVNSGASGAQALVTRRPWGIGDVPSQQSTTNGEKFHLGSVATPDMGRGGRFVILLVRGYKNVSHLGWKRLRHRDAPSHDDGGGLNWSNRGEGRGGSRKGVDVISHCPNIKVMGVTSKEKSFPATKDPQ